jgi:hypothetical protein
MAGTISRTAMATPIDQSGGHDGDVSLLPAETFTALFMNIEKDEFKRDRNVITGIVVHGL